MALSPDEKLLFDLITDTIAGKTVTEIELLDSSTLKITAVGKGQRSELILEGHPHYMFTCGANNKGEITDGDPNEFQVNFELLMNLMSAHAQAIDMLQWIGFLMETDQVDREKIKEKISDYLAGLQAMETWPDPIERTIRKHDLVIKHFIGSVVNIVKQHGIIEQVQSYLYDFKRMIPGEIFLEFSWSEALLCATIEGWDLNIDGKEAFDVIKPILNDIAAEHAGFKKPESQDE